MGREVHRYDLSYRYISARTTWGKKNAICHRSARVPGGTLVGDELRAFGLAGVPGHGTGGRVEYRLARNAVVSEFHKGRLSELDVCDAHPELMRAARNVGVPLSEECPICGGTAVVHVTYVFGPRLPSHGRCPTSSHRAGPAVPAGRRGGLLRRRGVPRLCLEPPGPDVPGRRASPQGLSRAR